MLLKFKIVKQVADAEEDGLAEDSGVDAHGTGVNTNTYWVGRKMEMSG